VFSELLILSFTSVKHDVSLFWQHMFWFFFPLAWGSTCERKKEKTYFWNKNILVKMEGDA